jgi:hypothetical protein
MIISGAMEWLDKRAPGEIGAAARVLGEIMGKFSRVGYAGTFIRSC